jgi:hypothetical protein
VIDSQYNPVPTMWLPLNASIERSASIRTDCFDALGGGGAAACTAMDRCSVCYGADTCGDCAGAFYGPSRADRCDGCHADPVDDCALDCMGVWGGGAAVDTCGACGGDDSCADCNGAPYGPARLDECGACDVDPANDCAPDCAGTWGGAALVDACGVCGGDDGTCLDCTGVPNLLARGSTLPDECGVCDEDWQNDCSQDCEGTWGGVTLPDACSVCTGTDTLCADCAGALFGAARRDECGACDADPATDCAIDCAGVWGGALAADACGVCGGDGAGCLDCAGIAYGTSAADECGVCMPNFNNACAADCLGVWGGADVLDACDVCGGDRSLCSDCAGIPYGDALLDECGACDNDPATDCGQDCALVWGGALALDACGVCGGDEGTCADCAGVPHGPALRDECGACDASAANDCAQDCALVWGGAAALDHCGVCAGNGSSCEDCAGLAFGNAVEDECGVCDALPANDCTEDCLLVWGGAAAVDGCGVCAGDNSTCSDCSGALYGPRRLDECATCDADADNDCGPDCAGTWGGALGIDWCGVCGGNNSTCIDCALRPMIDPANWATLDQCSTCDANVTNDCAIDCAGVWGGADSSGICGACGGTLDMCADCAGEEYGRSRVDECGACHADSADFCRLDCAGVWGGPAALDACGVCAAGAGVGERCDVVTAGWSVALALDGSVNASALMAAVDALATQHVPAPGGFASAWVAAAELRETSLTVRLRGVTSTFEGMRQDGDESGVQLQFRAGLAAVLGNMSVANVSVLGFSDTAAGAQALGRRRLQGQASSWVYVAYRVVSRLDLAATITNASFALALAESIQRSGNAVPAVFDLSVEAFSVATAAAFTMEVWEARRGALDALKVRRRAQCGSVQLDPGSKRFGACWSGVAQPGPGVN